MIIQEKVSIIMPTYNCGPYIADSIRSVQAQTYENWELFVVDDCSTDNTRSEVEAFLKDPRIHYFCLPKNGGPAAARNEALRQARGEYIAFLDSDDVWLPEKLMCQLVFMRENDYFFTCTGYRKMDENGHLSDTMILPHKSVGYWKTYYLSNPIGNSTVIYDRRHFGDRQVPMILKRNDFALWLQLLRDGSVCYGMEDILTNYRVRSQSVSSTKLRLAKYHWELYRRVEKKSLLTSALGMLSWAVVKGTGFGLRIYRSEEHTHGR